MPGDRCRVWSVADRLESGAEHGGLGTSGLEHYDWSEPGLELGG